MDIKNIIEAIEKRRILITDHADEEAAADGLKMEEIYFSVLQGEIIEKYLHDQPYPSCLIFGLIFNGDPVHSVWGWNSHNHWVVLITVYRPDAKLWIHWKRRRKLS